MRIFRDSLCISLVASGLIGAQILLNDRWLWSAAPSHAYGLVGFVALDLFFAVAVLARTGVPIIGTALTAAIQLGAMLADIMVEQPAGTPMIAFRNYLINDSSFLGLLIIQIGILILATGILAALFLQKHGQWVTFQPHSSR